jgi:hypothetical protein
MLEIMSSRHKSQTSQEAAQEDSGIENMIHDAEMKENAQELSSEQCSLMTLKVNHLRSNSVPNSINNH